MKISNEEIFRKVQIAVASMFEGDNPIEKLRPWMNSVGLTLEDLDRAVKSSNNGHSTVRGWMADTWNDMAQDKIYDANNSGIYENSDFYTIAADKKSVTIRKNPWK